MKKLVLMLAMLFFILPLMASAHGEMMGFGNFWFWAMGLNFVIWLIVGIFAIIWLWKKII